MFSKLTHREYQLERHYLTQYESATEFFDFCLKEHLYKEEEGFSSRMKKVYLGEKNYEGLSAIIAFHDNKAVGICLLEHFFEDNFHLKTQAGILHMDNRQRKNPWKIQLPWDFLHLGFMSFYVKKNHRGNGVATDMLKEMEQLQFSMFKNIPQDTVLTVTAKEKAYDLVNNSDLFQPTECQPFDGNYKQDISSVTYDIYFNDSHKKSISNYSLNILQPKLGYK